ncbi:hypothetical protein XM38_045270 [Halomicronema hongdechloris C2206]|uniref:Uncharacterized protein n=1 Tax=Halomicronema hongdechloris C2206 TaxID=1641165 RepID=A0A1Z3HTB5_9CYAN|nr:hypothetical protein [Halomicronema hongdechloris]ASC73558.1 hypothetical protein XM38_045270 [Halomicronema hongdechloris C2206]
MANSSSVNKQPSAATDAPGCDGSLVHLENVRQVQAEVLATAKAQRMAEFFVGHYQRGSYSARPQ